MIYILTFFDKYFIKMFSTIGVWIAIQPWCSPQVSFTGLVAWVVAANNNTIYTAQSQFHLKQYYWLKSQTMAK